MKDRFKLQDRQVRQGLSAALALVLIGSISYLGVKYFDFSKAASIGSIYVNSAESSWTQGSSVSVTIREESGSNPILQASFFLNYNSSLLQYTGFSETGEFDFVSPSAPTCTPISSGCPTSAGTLKIMRGMKGNTPVTGDHGIITLNFHVLGGSGSTDITLDKANSSLSGSDGSNILQSVAGKTFTLSPAVVADAALNFSPTSGNVGNGSSLSVQVRLNSPTQKATSTHVVVNYPASQLQYVGKTDSDTFPNDAQTAASAGTVDLIRGVTFGSSGVIGNDLVVTTLNFKVIGSSGSVPLSIKRASGAQDSGVYDTNGNNLLGSVGGANFTIPGGGQNPGPAPTPAPTQAPSGGSGSSGGGSGSGGGGSSSSSSSSTPVFRGNTSFTPQGGGSVALSGDSTQVSGNVDLAPVVDPSLLAQNPGDSIFKVEYYLNNKLVAAKTAAPFTYNIDTTKLKNGSYDMTVKTYYKSGTVDSQTSKLVVSNPVTLQYVIKHYGLGLFLTLLGLIVAAFLLWKYVWPRLNGASGIGGAPAYTDYTGYADDPDISDPGAMSGYEAPSPTVIMPTSGTGDNAAYDPAASNLQEPLAVANPQTFTPTQQPVQETTLPGPQQPVAGSGQPQPNAGQNPNGTLPPQQYPPRKAY